MLIRISQQDGTPVYQQVISQIQLLIATGQLEPGDKLPTVRALAAELVINPNTVARSYRELETLGLVTSRQGSGVFVNKAESPLSRKQRNARLNEGFDQLLSLASQLDFDLDTVPELLRQRVARFRKGKKS